MTYTEKILAEFDKKFNIFGECNPPHCHNMRWGGNFNDLKSFLSKSIDLAVAEERERVRENLPKIITPTVEPPPNNLSQNQIFASGQMNMLLRVTELLSSLQDKEAKGETK